MSHEPYSISGRRDVQSVYCSLYSVYFVYEAKSQVFKGQSLLLIHVLDWLGWFLWVALPSAPDAVVPACWVVPSIGGDVEACMDSRGIVCPNWEVPSTLEPGRVVASGWYRPHYCLLLEPVGGSVLSTIDWSVWIQIWSFEYEFGCLNIIFYHLR
jgi:hypothetical protein